MRPYDMQSSIFARRRNDGRDDGMTARDAAHPPLSRRELVILVVLGVPLTVFWLLLGLAPLIGELAATIAEKP